MNKDFINDQIVRLRKQLRDCYITNDYLSYSFYNNFINSEIDYWEKKLRDIERDEKEFEEYLEEPEQENYIEHLPFTGSEVSTKINEIIEVLNKLTKVTILWKKDANYETTIRL